MTNNPTISSRTPEGEPHRCPICGRVDLTELSLPAGDSCCPSCGSLLWWFRDRLAQRSGIPPDNLSLFSSVIRELGLDSLDVVELVMELEEEFDIDVPDEVAERIVTVADAIRYIQARRSKPE